MFFEIDFKILVVLLLFITALVPLRRWRRQFVEPYLYFSNLSGWGTQDQKPSRKAKWPRFLLWIALTAFAAAFVHPRVLIDKTWLEADKTSERINAPVEGIAIYFVLDQSGSMKEEVPVTIAGRAQFLSKIDLLKQVTSRFIKGDPQFNLKGRPNDLIGLIFFARGAHVLAPLTLDHEAVLKSLDQFNPVQDRDQDGTSIGYAIFKTVNLIAATRHYAQELVEKGEQAYEIKTSVIILVTDGLQDPNPLDKGKRLRNMDVPEAAAYAKKADVRLYIVNVEPKLSTEEFAPYQHIMQRAAESTQGKFYMVDSTTNLEQIYRDIDQLEKSVIGTQEEIDKDQRPDLYKRIVFYPYLIAVGLCCLFIYVMLETIFVRRIP